MDVIGGKAECAVRLSAKCWPAGIAKALAASDDKGQQNAETYEPDNGLPFSMVHAAYISPGR